MPIRSKALLWSARTTAGHPSMSGLEQELQNSSTALAASPRMSPQRCPSPQELRGTVPAR
eukprot:963275-Heterocapsa_arctica.AAC.1